MSKTDGTDERQRIRRILSGETGEYAYIVDAEPATLASRLHRIRKKLLLMMNQNENETARR